MGGRAKSGGNVMADTRLPLPGASRPQPPARAGMEVPERQDRNVRDGVDAGLPPDEAGAQGLAQHPPCPARRRRLRLDERHRRPRARANRREAFRARPALQPVSHDGALLSDARGASNGPQSSFGRDRRHPGDGDGLSGLLRRHSQGMRDVRRAPETVGLHLRMVRQEPQRARQPDEPGRSVRQLADQSGLRLFLRLHRR